jgi:hypothetical protein
MAQCLVRYSRDGITTPSRHFDSEIESAHASDIRLRVPFDMICALLSGITTDETMMNSMIPRYTAVCICVREVGTTHEHKKHGHKTSRSRSRSWSRCVYFGDKRKVKDHSRSLSPCALCGPFQWPSSPESEPPSSSYHPCGVRPPNNFPTPPCSLRRLGVDS